MSPLRVKPLALLALLALPVVASVLTCHTTFTMVVLPVLLQFQLMVVPEIVGDAPLESVQMMELALLLDRRLLNACLKDFRQAFFRRPETFAKNFLILNLLISRHTRA